MKLSDPMREVLKAANTPYGLRHSHAPDAARWPYHHSTLLALLRHELIEQDVARDGNGYWVEVWTTNDEGREALKPRIVYRVEQPLYLARGSSRYRQLPSGRWAFDDSHSGTGDYTSDARKSIDHDHAPNSKGAAAIPVLVDATDLDGYAAAARRREQAEKRRHGKTLDTLSLDDRIAQVERVAPARHANVTGELRLIRHMAAAGREQHATKRLVELEMRLQQRAA